MPRIISTARGDKVDFDALIIKHQLAQAPMNIEVAQRKRFIDSKEEKPKRQYIPEHNATGQPTVQVHVPTDEEIAAAQSRTDADFEPESTGEVKKMTSSDGPVPNLPVRNKK